MKVNKTVRVTLRVSPEEHAIMQDCSKKLQTSVSNYIRGLLPSVSGMGISTEMLGARLGVKPSALMNIYRDFKIDDAKLSDLAKLLGSKDPDGYYWYHYPHLPLAVQWQIEISEEGAGTDSLRREAEELGYLSNNNGLDTLLKSEGLI